MVLALTAPPARILAAGAPAPTGVVITVEDRARSDRLVTVGALVYSSAFSLVQLGLVIEYPGHAENATGALVATACYLPLHLRHVLWAVRGARPPAGRWTLAALAAVVAAAVPVAGVNWLPVFAVVAASAVLVLPWPWSLVVAGVVVVAQAPLAIALDAPLADAASYYVFTVWLRASALFVPIWLLGAVRQLQATRRLLAADALVRERVRLDDELRRTVGVALESIITRGEQATLAPDVREIVAVSRRALAESRRLISGYQRPTLAAELETAATLLTWAGIRTRIERPAQGLPDTTDPAVRSDLRAATAAVLHDDKARSCVIRVTRDGVELHTREAADP
jgi:two-component system, NarL family, sensor histidine kinase DesK